MVARQLRVTLLLSLAVSCPTFAGIVLSPILVLVMNDLRLDHAAMGLIFSAYHVGYTLGQIPWGYLVDRAGGRVIILSMLGTGLTSVLFTTSTGLVDATVWRFLTGLTAAGVFVPALRIVASHFDERKRGAAIGFTSVGPSVVSIVGPPIVTLAALAYHWRYSIFIAAASSLIGAVILWVFLKDSTVRPESEGKKKGRELLLRESFWILGYSQFVRLGLTYTLIAWMPAFLFEVRGFDLVLAGLSVSVMSVAAIFGNPLGGVLSDRFGRIRVMIYCLVGSALCVISFAFADNYLAIWGIIALAGLFLNSLRAPMFAILPDIYGVEPAGRLTGYHNTFASAGAFALPFFLGVTRGMTGTYLEGWIILTALVSLSFILTPLLKKEFGY